MRTAVRIALISDIHANLDALGAVAPRVASCDEVVCLGDVVGYYTEVNEVIAWLRALPQPFHMVLGNHDAFVVGRAPDKLPAAVQFGVDHARRTLTADHRAWLERWPLVLGRTFDGVSLLASHGSPWRPLDDYLYADNPKLAKLDEFAFDVIAFGQTHRALLRQDPRPRLLNPGSVGQSRDRVGQAAMAILDTRDCSIEMVLEPYDPSRVRALALAAGAGPWIDKHLVDGGPVAD